MSAVQILATTGAAVGLLVGLLTIGLSRAPGCRELRWLSLISLSAGLVCALRGGAGVCSDAQVVVMTRVGVSFAGLMTYAWLRYEASDRAATRSGRVLAGSALAFSVASLVPGLVIANTVIRRSDYPDVPPTLLGALGLLGLIGAATVLLWRYVTRARAGELGAGAHAVALLGLQLAALHDTLDGAWLHRSIPMLPVGLLWMTLAIGVALVGRFVRGARSLSLLSERLEHAVRERTNELASARATLVETEQLATLGRLAAALAHEMNNPLAVVAANLAYLRDGLTPEAPDAPEQLEAYSDTLESVDRVAGIIRQLGDAGELAMRGGSAPPVHLSTVLQAAVSSARQRSGDNLRVTLDVQSALHVSTLEGSLRQVVASLIVAAVQSMEQVQLDGAVHVHAERNGERIILRIEDEAPEQDDILRDRRFRRFLDSRPEAVQGDVGLSVSLALLRMLGARVDLERSGDEGSIVRIELRAAEAPEARAQAPASSPSARARVLIVDDDVLTRIGLRRLLGREYVIEEADGVDRALAVIREQRGELDAIVADLVMPDGGGQRLLEELEREVPELAAATLLLTGGAIDEQSGSFLARHADRVLRKPLNVATLRTLIERVRIRRSGQLARLRRDG